jgi:hypothetical protein
MYSAFIPGSTAQTFQIPAVTSDGNQATWTVSDSSQASLQNQTFTSGDADAGDQVTLDGVMITVQGVGTGGSATTPGTLTITATEGSACGVATLNITQSSEDLWNVGNTRYNNGNNLHLGPPIGPDGGFERPEAGGGGGGGGGGGFMLSDGGSPFETDGGTACTNCHGPTATASVFKDVQHTPEQTGGFSDDDLGNIILKGVVPSGGYFDPAVINPSCNNAGTTLSTSVPSCFTSAYAEWQGFHKWTDITSDELPGVITYLRALTPESQTGSPANFGGGGGKFPHHDGGTHPPPPSDDSGSPTGTDAGTDAALEGD